jgi:hypothetical protein
MQCFRNAKLFCNNCGMYLIHTKQTDKMRRENTKPANISVDYYYLYSFCDFDSSVDTKTLKLDFLCETDRAVSSTMNDPIKNKTEKSFSNLAASQLCLFVCFHAARRARVADSIL